MSESARLESIRARGYARIATEEAFAPAAMLERYRRMLARHEFDDPGFESLWGFYLGSQSPRATQIIARLQDLGPQRVADMDATGIDRQIISLTAPGVQVFDAPTAVSMARDANEELAEAVRRLPQRYSKTGDFTLCDSTRQYEIVFPGSNRMLVLGIPEAQLRRQIATPECMVAIPMQASCGVRGLFSRFLRSYWVECRRELDDTCAQRVTTAIMDLLGAAYADAPCPRSSRSSLATAHRLRIINYIETHLHDPDLTPTRIAAACKMTPRYLYHLSSDQEETVARYILRRRLEICSRALVSEAQRRRTVTEIAFDHGFNSPTHFGRVFRARFGLTPREYRRRHTAGG